MIVLVAHQAQTAHQVGQVAVIHQAVGQTQARPVGQTAHHQVGIDMEDMELRFVERFKTLTTSNGHQEMIPYNILQYRKLVKYSDKFTGWTEWQDVPLEAEG